MPLSNYLRTAGCVVGLAFVITGCQTTEPSGISPAVADAWNGPFPRLERDGGSPAGRAIGSPLGSASTKVGEPTLFDGTGRFIGTSPSESGIGSSEPPTDGVTINLVGVPLSQAAKAVLGDVVGVRYTLDPGIDGKVTLQTPAPVSRPAAVELFQAAIRPSNAALVYSGGVYRVVPLDQANAGSRLHVEGDPGAQSNLGTGVRVVQLKFVNASEIRRILDPISPKGGVVRVDDARNTITLSGSDQDVSGMLEAISIFDIDVMKGMSFGIVPVRTSQPSAIADELKTIFASDREGPMGGMVRFLPNKRLGAILVVTPQAKYLSRAVTWIKKLDSQAEGTEKQFYTYSVQNRRAKELVTVLQSMFATSKDVSGSPASARNVAPPYQEASLQSPATTQTQPSGGGGLSLASASSLAQPNRASGADSSATPTSSVQLGRDEATGEARIRVGADEAKNAILIEATPADYRRLMRMIGSLDVIPSQVLIEATIAEVSLNDELKFGVRWYMQQKNSSYTFTDDATGAVSSVFPGFSYALKAANITATLTALNAITTVNVISSPSLTVADNRTAQLQVGDEVPITTQSAVSVLTPGSPVVNSVSYKDTGVILSITPRINESGRVMLDIEQEVSTVSNTTSSGIDSPTISQRRVRTTVVVNDGEAFALGGMMQNSKTVTNTQIPVVGDIPYLGSAFKMKDNKIGKTELIILIAPHVIRNLTEARRITDEFRREMAISIPNLRTEPKTYEQTFRRTLE